MTSADAAPPAAPDPRAIEALLAFWADAGVDACLADAPIDRLAARAAPAPAPAAEPLRPDAPAPHPGNDRVARARELAASASTIEALAEAARTLLGRAAVSFEGTAPARLMVIGDAPNTQDEAEGLPFRGPRGGLLRALLAAAGLGEGVLYANSAFRRPPGGGDPAPAAQAEAAPFLARAATLAAPSAVLLLGACATRALAGVDGPILRLRGRWTTWAPEGAPPVSALPTLGPDFLLAHPLSKKAAWGDVLSLAARLAGDGPTANF